MRRPGVLLPLLVLLGLSSPAWSSSLEEARRLRQVGEVDRAIQEIRQVLGSDASEDEKAEALDLLGTIAVDQGYLPIAREAWQRLIDEYPQFVESTDALTKLSLVSALLAARGEEPISTAEVDVPATEEDEERRSEPEAGKPVESESRLVPSETSPVEPETPERAATPPQPSAQSAHVASPGLVLVAGRGRPHDAVREATSRVVELLRERGVNAASATAGIPVVRESDLVLPLLLQKATEDGASSVLLLTADFTGMQNMSVRCYTPTGEELWRVKTAGGTGWTGRDYTKTGINEALADRLNEKLVEKIGDTGLPVTLD